jgi:hypothetical protein
MLDTMRAGPLNPRRGATVCARAIAQRGVSMPERSGTALTTLVDSSAAASPIAAPGSGVCSVTGSSRTRIVPRAWSSPRKTSSARANHTPGSPRSQAHMVARINVHFREPWIDKEYHRLFALIAEQDEKHRLKTAAALPAPSP